jgi:chaperonin GroEL
VIEALTFPCKQIAENAGEDGDVVVAEIMENKNDNYGYNAATGEYGDMFKLGIIDPAKVARTALLNAASAIGLALTTDVLITELKEPKHGEESAKVSGAVV